MPITLVTGLPGHGKTLYTLFRLKKEAEETGRPIFQCSGESDPVKRASGELKGIPGLKLPWPVIDPMKWHEAPAGAIVIIDEAQFVFPIRGRGEPPEWVARLATHRHLGIDIFLITQGPMLIDSFVRALVDRHFDVVRKFGTHFATIHEYANGVRENVRKSRGSDSIRHEWRYPKEVFELYQSAEIHTVKRRIPARVWLLGVMPLVFVAAAYVAYLRLSPKAAAERYGGVPAAESASAPAGVAGAAPGQGGARAVGAGQAGPAGAADYAQQYSPRIAGLPHTAVAYDELTKPVEAPYPAACLMSASRCQCYTQQGTQVETPRELCERIVRGGFFIAWQQPEQREPVRRAAASQEPQRAPVPAPAQPVLADPRADLLAGPVDQVEQPAQQPRPGGWYRAQRRAPAGG